MSYEKYINESTVRDITRRIYDEVVLIPDERHDRYHSNECFLDGLWTGLKASGMRMCEFTELEDEINRLFDGLIEGEWE